MNYKGYRSPYSVGIPRWKLYLFNYLDRVKEYRRLLTKYKELNKIKPKWVKAVLTRYGREDAHDYNTLYMYWEMYKVVEQNLHRCTKPESVAALKIKSLLKKLHLEDLKMETKELKNYAKQVGISWSKIKEMDEDEIIHAIINAVEDDGNYNSEFVEWYNDLPSKYFDDADDDDDDEKPVKKSKKSKKDDDDDDDDEKPVKKSKKSKKDEEEEEEPEDDDTPDVEEIQDDVENADSLEELREIIKENDTVFPSKFLKEKDFEELQEKMLEVLEGLSEEEDDDEKPVKKGKKAKEEEEEEEDDKIAAWKKMNPMQLKKVCKEYDIKTKKTDTKDKLLKKLIDAYEGSDVKESKEEVDIEIDQSLVKKLIKSKDTDKLIEIAETLEIKISALDKRSPSRLGEKIIDFLTEKEEEEEKAAKPKGRPKKKVKDDDDDDDTPKLKKKVEKDDDDDDDDDTPKLRKKKKVEKDDDDDDDDEKPVVKKRGRGRPPGSTNKKNKEAKEEKEEKKKESKSIYRKIERLMEKGKSQKEIIKAVTPDFVDEGKDADYAKKRIKQIIEMIEEEEE